MKTNEFIKKSLTMLTLTATFSLTACAAEDTSKEDDTLDVSGESIQLTTTEEHPMTEPMENIPEASYWFPEDLLEWDFESDLDAKYNVSTVPLAERVNKESLEKSNDTQNADMNVAALSIMNSTTSGNVPRGTNTFDANVFSNWQYVDQMVYWGGSSGEGIIVPPSADVIDAAHKNGVPILGTIFFPQTAHAGKIEWLDTFLSKDENGNFPIIDKLIEVADVYGFDGWFINQETDTEVTSFDDAAEGKEAEESNSEGLSKKHANLMQELIIELQEKAEGKLEIMWYDSMTTEGEMDWQNALTDKNSDYLVREDEKISDSMFLNFWWNTENLAGEELLKESNEKADELNINPYDLYAGIDVQENGFNTPVRWNLFMDENNQPYTSLGLYVPTWTYSSATDGDPNDFQSRESIFWVNEEGDPTKSILPEEMEWPGISTFAVEQTAITKLPFTSNFNLGHGLNYFIEGEKVSNLDWNNRSMQDVLPTYRWVFDHEGENDLKVTIDYADAYQGGNSLKLSGNMKKDQSTTMKMYSTELELTDDTSFTTTAKASNETKLNLILDYVDGETEVFEADKNVDDNWITVEFDIGEAVGKVVKTISYEIVSSEDSERFDLNFGQIAVTLPSEETDFSVNGLTIEDVVFEEIELNQAGVRLFWDTIESDLFSHYEIYRVNTDDTRSFLGATPAETHYLNGLERHDDTNETKIEVVPVDIFGVRGESSEIVTVEWPDNSLPRASFKSSSTLAAPGAEISFTNTSSNSEEVEWTFEGADIETSTDENPTVTYDEEGTYSVKLNAINEVGETPLEIEQFITITKQVDGKLSLLSEGVSTEGSSYTNDAELPEFTVDGSLETKWAAVGEPPHDIVLDLGKPRALSEVHMAHAEAGGESSGMNTKSYSILVSEDGEEFDEVARILDNSEAETIDTFPAVDARYVKIEVDGPTQGSDNAVRIYEIEVYGLESTLNQ